jgi:spermidine synthase
MSQQNPILASTSSPNGKFLPLLLLLFVGSGCAALIYEIVWYQMLLLVLGSTAISLAVVLGTFMGGMCIGSLLLSFVVSRRHHPLRVYAFMELGIGIIGFAMLWLMPVVASIYTKEAVLGVSDMMLRTVVAAVCLLPPTVLMGATLPAIARWVESTPKGVSWMGFFYGSNIAGAVFGCLLAGFLLLPYHDVSFASYVAVAINITVCLLGLGLAVQAPHNPPADASADQRAQRAPGAWAAYITIALSGMSALGAEVVWTRLMSLLLGGTVYTFSIILAVFLVGLGIGSSIGSFMSRGSKNPRVALGICQLLLVLAIGWTAFTIAYSMPYWPIDPSYSTSPWYNFQLDLMRTVWAILPATILWGASFPLALAAVASRGKDPGRLVGGVYAANTIGAIAGAVLFSLVVIPGRGTQFAQELMIAIAGAATLTTLLPILFPSKTETPAGSQSIQPALLSAIGSVFAVALTVLMAWSVGPTPWGLIAYGRFTATYAEKMEKKLISATDPGKEIAANKDKSIFCIYQGEGLNGSVCVTQDRNGYRCFHSAGKVQASSQPQDMRLQRMLGHLSALLCEKPSKVLVVACGAGVTAGTFTTNPDVDNITICDIEPLVPKHVAPLFKDQNYNVVNFNDDNVHLKPRVNVVVDDGRHFVRTYPEKFDIITSDPIDPWVKGCAAMYTEEYYQMCRDHLNPGGLMTLWIPLYESNLDSVKSVIATFFKVFPNGILWSNDRMGEGYDAVLFGQVEPEGQTYPVKINVDALQEKLDSDKYRDVKQSLSEAGFNSAVDLLATYAGRAPDMQEWSSTAQINTDWNMRLQYLAGMWFNKYIGREILTDIWKSYKKFPDEVFTGSPATLQSLQEAITRPRIGNANAMLDSLDK